MIQTFAIHSFFAALYCIDILFLGVFTYTENEFFKLLNCTLQGQIVHRKHKNSKHFDYKKLKDIVIFDRIKEDNVNYT